MIRPRELASGNGWDVRDTITSASTGDTPALQRLFAREPGLSRAQHSYTQPIHFAVHSGHLEAVQLLLDILRKHGAAARCGRFRVERSVKAALSSLAGR